MLNGGVVTQIGCVPYLKAKNAVKYSLEHDIPFLPELYRRGEYMMEIIKSPGKVRCLEDFSKAVKGKDTAKIQCVGPATLVAATQGAYSEREAVDRTHAHLSWVREKLRDVPQVIMFLDEPLLGMVAYDYARKGMTKQQYESYGGVSLDYQSMWNELNHKLSKGTSVEDKIGVHTCGNMRDWSQLFDSELINIISFDASKYTRWVRRYDRKDKIVAWGLNNLGDLSQIKDKFQYGDLLTLTCGMGPAYRTPHCRPKLNMLRKAASYVNHQSPSTTTLFPAQANQKIQHTPI